MIVNEKIEMINIEEKGGKIWILQKGDLAWHNIFIIGHKI